MGAEELFILFALYMSRHQASVSLETAFCKVEWELGQVLLKYLSVDLWKLLNMEVALLSTVLQSRVCWYCNYNTTYPSFHGKGVGRERHVKERK